MSRRLALMLSLLHPVLLVATAVSGALEGTIRLEIAQADLSGASIAISVIEAGPGNAIVDLDSRALRIPASNLKLLTTGAALHALGSDFKFETRLIRDGERLIVVGDGDPGFGDPILLAEMKSASGREMDVETLLALWVDAVVARGLDTVTEIAIDDRVFDQELVHPTWPADQLNRRYCAQVSGLCFHLNQAHFYPEPRPDRRPSLQRYTPRSSMIQIENSATSRTGVHDDDTVWISRRLETNRLTVYGNVKHAYRTPVPVTLHDMPLLFGEMLAERLRQRGVAVERVRRIEMAEPEPAGETVGPVIRTSMTTAVTRCNRDSQNLYAECLIKRMGSAITGQPGSWLNGASIVRHVVYERLDDVGLSSRLRIADGSGLSRQNLVSPATLTAWLNSFHNDEELGAIYIDSLAAGGTSGTLRSRLAPDDLDGAVVHAKSGYINGVSCLSGYVTAPNGRRRCFSIMVNDLRSPVRKAKRLQDRVVLAVAKDLLAEVSASVPALGGD